MLPRDMEELERRKAMVEQQMGQKPMSKLEKLVVIGVIAGCLVAFYAGMFWLL